MNLNNTFGHSNKYSGFTNWGECLDHLKNYYIVKKIYWRKVFDIYIYIYICTRVCACVLKP